MEKTAYIPLGLFATNLHRWFRQGVFKGVKVVVTPQESACLILFLSCLLPSHTVLLHSVLTIRAHL